ncbi:alpha/beta hydrolase [Halobacillus sp. Marseille-Q1614]|uniref:alpha/beta hydrolase n=1 Tax=Halobacillus sp. Marseille-Q1614 TaxID=2709134 RepID=UPI001571442A|nr:alpha/beta hydrolase [Halobacillus sp. Marseille-Q1614]
MSEEILYDYYVDKIGTGPPVLFLPAAGFTGSEGLNIAKYLEDRLETHLLDLPGYGRSAGIDKRWTDQRLAEWVNEYVEQQQLEKTDVIGHSLGGAVALSFTAHFPEKVNRLVLLDQGHKPFPRIPTTEFEGFAYAFPFLNIGARLLGQSSLKWAAPLFENQERPGDVDEKLSAFCEKVGIKEDPFVRHAYEHQADFSVSALNLMFGFYNLKMRPLIRKLQVPTLLAYGTFEGMEEEEQKRTAIHINQLKKENLPITYRPVRGGHYVHWSDWGLLMDIRKFLLTKESVR